MSDYIEVNVVKEEIYSGSAVCLDKTVSYEVVCAVMLLHIMEGLVELSNMKEMIGFTVANHEIGLDDGSGEHYIVKGDIIHRVFDDERNRSYLMCQDGEYTVIRSTPCDDIDDFATVLYLKDNKVHREDGPAFSCGGEDLISLYVRDNVVHNLDGPAETFHEEKVWFVGGCLDEMISCSDVDSNYDDSSDIDYEPDNLHNWQE